jgi:ABC-2 type transport system permease protein
LAERALKKARQLPDTVVPPWRLLLWLKATLTLRGLGRDKMKALSVVIMFIAFAPLSLGIAWAVYSFSASEPHLTPFIFNGVLAAIYLLWIFSPLFGFALNETYDPTRLFVYPLSYRTIFACSVLGGLFDLPTLLMLPLLVALTISAAGSLVGGVLSAAIMLVFLFHTLAVSQGVVLALIGLLRSRRFRDITIVVLPVIGVLFYLGQSAAIRATGTDAWARLLHNPVLSAFALLPSGWAANGLSSVADGRYGAAFGWLAAVLAALAVSVALAGRVMRGLYLGESGGAAPASVSAVVASQPETGHVSRLPAAMAAIMTKERRHLARDPAYKAVFVQMIYMVVVMVMPWVQMGSGQGALHDMPPLVRNMLPFVVATAVTSVFLPLTYNILGGEGRAITVLLSMPSSRREIILGKNLVHAAVLTPVPLIVVVVGCILGHTPQLIGMGMVWVAIEVATVLGLGNVVSMLLPHRMVVRGQGYSRPGCGYIVLQILAYGVGLVVLAIPAAAVAVAVWRSEPALTAALLTGSVIYAAVVYVSGLLLGEKLLQDREQTIIERLAPSGE